MKSEQNTRQQILDAALIVFHQNGFNGARTTRIAALAGISRTMLHYYFSTKEALFEAVLAKTFGSILPHIQRLSGEESDLFTLIEHLVDIVADMLDQNPGLPSFIVNVLNENPELILNISTFRDENTPGMIDVVLEKAKKDKRVCKTIKAEDLVINIWALCATPYLIGPYIAAKEKRNEAAMRAFIQARKKSITDLIIKGIKH